MYYFSLLFVVISLTHHKSHINAETSVDTVCESVYVWLLNFPQLFSNIMTQVVCNQSSAHWASGECVSLDHRKRWGGWTKTGDPSQRQNGLLGRFGKSQLYDISVETAGIEQAERAGGGNGGSGYVESEVKMKKKQWREEINKTSTYQTVWKTCSN